MAAPVEELSLGAGYFRNMMDVLEIWQRDFSISEDLKTRAKELHLEASCRAGDVDDAENKLSNEQLVEQYNLLTRDIAVRFSVSEPSELQEVKLFRPGLKFMRLLAHSYLGIAPKTKEMKEAQTLRFHVYLRLHLYLENHLSEPPTQEFKDTYQAGLLDHLLASQGAFQLTPDQYRIIYQGLPDLNLVWLLINESKPSLAQAKQDYEERIVPLRDAALAELQTTSTDPNMNEERAEDAVYSMEGQVQEAIASRINHVEQHLLQVPRVGSFVSA